MRNVFKERLVLEQTQYKKRFNDLTQFQELDSRAINHLMIINKKVFLLFEQNFVFYYLDYPTSKKNQFLSEKQQFFLSHQIQKINENILELEKEINAFTLAAAKNKKKNQAEDAKK